MAIDTKLFWNRLLESQILDEAACASLQQSFQSKGSQVDASPENLADWLGEQKAISQFQADILLADCPGPFKFGNYLIVDRLGGTPQVVRFLGRHTSTGHPVLIDFVAGSDADGLQRWQRIRTAADSLAASWHPNLLQVFESVAIPQYRFVVTAVPDGQPLLERIPLKTRLPWNKANQIVGQAASVLVHLHARSLDRIPLLPETLWITDSGMLQVVFPFEAVSVDLDSGDQSIDDLSAAADVNCSDLGALWYRLLTGRTRDSELDSGIIGNQDIKRLQKFEVPEESVRLIQSIFQAENSIRPVAETIVEHCRRMAPWDESSSPSKKNATLAAYQAWLVRSPQSIRSDSVMEIDGRDFQLADHSTFLYESTDNESAVSIFQNSNPISDNTVLEQRRTSGYSMAAAIAGSMLAIGLLTAIVITLTINRPNGMASLPVNNTTTNAPDRLPVPVQPGEPNADNVLSTESVKNHQARIASTFDQILIDDDGQSLWETPTAGPPVSFRFVPLAPKLAVVVRPAELLSTAEGKRLILALGPEMNRQIERWQQQVGMILTEITQITMTLHSGEDFSYDPFFVIETLRSVSTEDLLQAWGNPKLQVTGDGNNFYTHGSELAYRFVDSSVGGTTRFAVGPQSLVEESLQLNGADPLAGSMKMLASWSDNDRHISLLFLRAGLFDDAGQKLMSGSMTRLNRELSLAIDTNIRGGMLSLHLDHGTYLELRLDRTDDLRADELEQLFAELLQRLPTTTAEFLNQLNASDYWNDAKKRIATMMTDFSLGWRIGSEDKRFIANCWLPEAAAHNLVASTEMMLAFADQRIPNGPADLRNVPQNLEELLAIPRDLAVSTSPDLIILINQLQQEIREDHGSLPFDFEIRLMGNDLSRDGITQNQRPGNFEMKQQPLSDILTEIMVQANPNKNISGASDPDCKLVWVVAADPADASRQIVLITTRSAAAQNSYQLPAVFVAD